MRGWMSGLLGSITCEELFINAEQKKRLLAKSNSAYLTDSFPLLQLVRDSFSVSPTACLRPRPRLDLDLAVVASMCMLTIVQTARIPCSLLLMAR